MEKKKEKLDLIAQAKKLVRLGKKYGYTNTSLQVDFTTYTSKEGDVRKYICFYIHASDCVTNPAHRCCVHAENLKAGFKEIELDMQKGSLQAEKVEYTEIKAEIKA